MPRPRLQRAATARQEKFQLPIAGQKFFSENIDVLHVQMSRSPPLPGQYFIGAFSPLVFQYNFVDLNMYAQASPPPSH
jgi:hypothetical protein